MEHIELVSDHLLEVALKGFISLLNGREELGVALANRGLEVQV